MSCPEIKNGMKALGFSSPNLYKSIIMKMKVLLSLTIAGLILSNCSKSNNNNSGGKQSTVATIFNRYNQFPGLQKQMELLC